MDKKDWSHSSRERPYSDFAQMAGCAEILLMGSTQAACERVCLFVRMDEKMVSLLRSFIEKLQINNRNMIYFFTK